MIGLATGARRGEDAGMARTIALTLIILAACSTPDLGDHAHPLDIEGYTFYYERSGPMVIEGAPVNPTCGAAAPDKFELTFITARDRIVTEGTDPTRYCDVYGTPASPERWIGCWFQSATIAVSTDLDDQAMPGVLLYPACFEIYNVTSAWYP